MFTNGIFPKAILAHSRRDNMEGQYLKNRLLIAMPQMQDPYFERTVTLICDHNEQGALGIVINRPMPMQFGEVLEQLEMPVQNYADDRLNQAILIGGPVAPENGLVLHERETDRQDIWDSTMEVSKQIRLTTSQDILRAMAAGQGPRKHHFALGYSGWDAGQLEDEIRNNSWLIAPSQTSIVFDLPFSQRWEAAALAMGIDLDKLSHTAGHA